MPRQPRIDIEGGLQHVMIRGIEKREIFLDDRDRSAFICRLSQLLVKTQTDCLAWSLLSFLFRPTMAKLSELMLCLLTGYAVVFNLRYHRCGHLFQNRYRSILCEEDSYLLELVRYIHLNPLRAGLVPSIRKLDTYKWSGHAGIMGYAVLPGQVVDDILLMFDDDKKRARSKYRVFVTEGVALGRRNELVGGGLKRHLKLSGQQDYEAYDERILGSGEFVERVWQDTETLDSQVATPPPLDEIIERVAAFFGVQIMSLRLGSKQKQISTARAVICFVAVRVFGYTGVEISKHLGLSESGVVLAARRGDAHYEMSPTLRELFLKQ